MHERVACLVFVFVFSVGLCKKLPAEFQICKRNDPKFNECLKMAVQDAYPRMEKGIPSLNVPPIEPLNVPSVTIGEGKGPVNVKQKYNDLNIFNLIKSKVDKLEVSLGDQFKLHVFVSAPEYRLEATYDFNGRILLLPIVGVGKCTIRLIETKAELIITGEKIEKGGKTYLEIKDFKVILNPEKVHFNFENLFNGDERLGTEMNKVLNENWKEVFEDVKPGYEEFLGSIGKHVTNSIFTKVPYDEMFPPQ